MGAAKFKMLFPTIPARIEEQRDRISERVDPREVRTFVQIAAITGQCQILGN